MGPDLVGLRTEPMTVDWSERDVMLYALGVGAGSADPSRELNLTTQNTAAHPLVTLPTFAGSLVLKVRPEWPRPDGLPVLHASQAVALTGPVPTAGAVVAQSWVEGVYDKRSGAVVHTRTEARRPDSTVAFTVDNRAFVVGAGGFGGAPDPGTDEPVPDREPDAVLRYVTRTDLALLFRLSGDSNPLHTDPEQARRAGFDRPILHGLAVSGIGVRLLVNELADGDPTRVSGFSARYTAPVRPGQELSVAYWREPDRLRFRMIDDTGRTVCDRAVISWFGSSGTA